MHSSKMLMVCARDIHHIPLESWFIWQWNIWFYSWFTIINQKLNTK